MLQWYQYKNLNPGSCSTGQSIFTEAVDSTNEERWRARRSSRVREHPNPLPPQYITTTEESDETFLLYDNGISIKS